MSLGFSYNIFPVLHIRIAVWMKQPNAKEPMILKAGADSGIPVGRGANSRGGANIPFCQILKKLHETEKILGHKGVTPLRSATERCI